MRIIVFVIVLSFSCLPSIGQSLFMQGVDTPWSTGELTLNDGTQFKGVIKYNEQIGSITYKADTLAKESRTFSEQDLIALAVLDSTKGHIRRLYSFPYEDDEQKEVILLFEVIKEFNNWAVLSRKSGIKVNQNKGDVDWSSPNPYYTTKTKIAQAEYFYIMDENGSIEFFFVSEIHESDGLFGSQKNRSKMYEDELLMGRMNPFTSQVENFAKKNKLKSNKTEDLLQILDYYESLVKQE